MVVDVENVPRRVAGDALFESSPMRLIHELRIQYYKYDGGSVVKSVTLRTEINSSPINPNTPKRPAPRRGVARPTPSLWTGMEGVRSIRG
ncbi:hypothetical protein EVAR_43683_1 [Eumeta japonica]|uniref:Uncharacterized protein n=1 Tax=Eumeta variegata TaxID=151549 RepID=A0A4C1WYX7_EUMVA|nr:hypothetical protein EVAR_43683_1 [Eumeta japonica]